MIYKNFSCLTTLFITFSIIWSSDCVRYCTQCNVQCTRTYVYFISFSCPSSTIVVLFYLSHSIFSSVLSSNSTNQQNDFDFHQNHCYKIKILIIENYSIFSPSFGYSCRLFKLFTILSIFQLFMSIIQHSVRPLRIVQPIIQTIQYSLHPKDIPADYLNCSLICPCFSYFCRL